MQIIKKNIIKELVNINNILDYNNPIFSASIADFKDMQSSILNKDKEIQITPELVEQAIDRISKYERKYSNVNAQFNNKTKIYYDIINDINNLDEIDKLINKVYTDDSVSISEIKTSINTLIRIKKEFIGSILSVYNNLYTDYLTILFQQHNQDIRIVNKVNGKSDENEE